MAARRRCARGGNSVLAALAAAATFLIAVGAAAVPVAAADQPVNGSGSTFAAIAIDQWRADAASQLGLEVRYNATGSTTGRTQFAAGVVDWASSDLPYMIGLDAFPSQPYAYMPLVASGIGLLYNLRDAAGDRIDGVRLTGPLAAQVFTGRIQSWRDPAILAAQTGDVAARLPDLPIQRVVRADSSGSTAVVMQYWAAVAPEEMQALRDRFAAQYRTPNGVLWTDVFPGLGTSDPDWRLVTYVNGSFAMATLLANSNSNGAIGYVESGYALAAGLPLVRLENAAGSFTLPTPRNVAVALSAAAGSSDGTQDLSGVFASLHPEAYPISSYSYAIVPTTGVDPAKGSTLGKFLTYALTRGQDRMAPLGYSPLPPNLVQQGFDVIRQIAGAPDPGPLGDWGQQYLSLDPAEVQYPVRDQGIIS